MLVKLFRDVQGDTCIVITKTWPYHTHYSSEHNLEWQLCIQFPYNYYFSLLHIKRFFKIFHSFFTNLRSQLTSTFLEIIQLNLTKFSYYHTIATNGQVLQQHLHLLSIIIPACINTLLVFIASRKPLLLFHILHTVLFLWWWWVQLFPEPTCICLPLVHSSLLMLNRGVTFNYIWSFYRGVL